MPLYHARQKLNVVVFNRKSQESKSCSITALNLEVCLLCCLTYVYSTSKDSMQKSAEFLENSVAS